MHYATSDDCWVQRDYIIIWFYNCSDLFIPGIKIFDSTLFTINGDQPHSFVWTGYEFELHIPKGTCLPGEKCDIEVYVAMGGDFVLPKRVEPMSAVFIISTAEQFHPPLLLKIQHCVALEDNPEQCG